MREAQERQKLLRQYREAKERLRAHDEVLWRAAEWLVALKERLWREQAKLGAGAGTREEHDRLASDIADFGTVCREIARTLREHDS